MTQFASSEKKQLIWYHSYLRFFLKILNKIKKLLKYTEVVLLKILKDLVYLIDLIKDKRII